ncbi:MAG: hypothetical protein HY043_01035 [Verrucomicrobia bacterium]|nr:hypothetical protein [Verrucomicrobiota bacterium]
MTNPSSITIDGLRHHFVYLEKDDAGHETGIVTSERTFWMKPLCRRDLRPLHRLPVVAPVEIAEVTFNSEDVPAKFLARLESEAQQIRKHFEGMSIEEFARSRKGIQALDKAQRPSIERELHRLQQMSLADMRSEWFVIEQMWAFGCIKNEAKQLREHEAWELVGQIKYLAQYEDGSRIYLTALEAAEHSREVAQEIRSRLGKSSIESASQEIQQAVHHGFLLISGELTETKAAIDSHAAKQAQANQQAAKERAEILEKTKAAANLPPAVEKLIEQHKQVESAKQEDMAKAFREIFHEMKPAPIDMEILHLYWDRGFSQDRIVEELRKQKRGKAKSYVGKVIRLYNEKLEAKRYRGKYRVTGPPLPADSAWQGSGEGIELVPVEAETPYMKLDEAEMEGILKRWDRLSEAERKQHLEEYPELQSTLKRKGRLGEEPI